MEAKHEWETFKADVLAGLELEELRQRYGLAPRNARRTLRRAQRTLGLPFTVPPETDDPHALSVSSKFGNRAAAPVVETNPTRLALASPVWEWLRPLEKAAAVLGRRLGRHPDGCYSLDGRRAGTRDVIAACNAELVAVGADPLPWPGLVEPSPQKVSRGKSAPLTRPA